MMPLPDMVPSKQRSGFTLVELLIVISIMAIMAAMVISAFSNVAEDSRRVLVRQQQAVVQQAVNSWLTYRSGATRSLSTARTEFNSAKNTLERLALVKGYLDDATYDELIDHTEKPDQVQSEAMLKTSQYLEITEWSADSYPKINLLSL